jgi:hypothetical protein
MPFLLDGNPSASEISDAINYILANLAPGTPAGSQVVNNNPTTGFITNTGGDLLQYQYRYVDIKYADNTAGLNFSDNPYSRLYFGIYNTDSVTESTNPADYTWFQVTGGFGGTKVLWVVTSGGRHAGFAVSQEAPDTNQNWRIVPTRSIDLDNPFAVFNQYMSVKFATNSIGTTGFGNTITNATYFGVATSSDGSTSTNPADYEWSPFAFGTTYSLFYRTYGGRNISFSPALYQPIGNIPYTPGTVLNLDVVTLGSVDSLGVISLTPLVIESPFRYLLVKYATSNTGTGISNDPTGKTYFGLQASDVLTIDTNPADYQWFSAGGTFLTGVNLWARTTGGTTATLSLTLEAPDTSGWQNVSAQTTSSYPNIDVYARSGIVVVDVTSPTAGRIGFSNVDANGIVNLNLDPYGQGKNSGGFTINPATTALITFDEFGRVVQSGALDQVRFSSMLTTATSGQTVFTFSNAQADQIMVFRNGAFLVPSTDYTRTSTDVTFSNACTTGDKIAIYYIRLVDGITSADKVPFVTSSQTLVNGQVDIITTYPDGSEVLFINGVMITDSDYGYRGANTGYTLNTPSTGGKCTIVSFSFNNGNALIFSENYSVTTYASSAITFPTSFYRNSHLMWINGCLMRPGTDYTMAGTAALINGATLVGILNYSNQPVQFISFNSAGEASASSVSAAGVLGMDMPVVIETPMTMFEIFQTMQEELDKLKFEVEMLKGTK